MARATLVGRPGSPGLGVGRLLWVPPEADAPHRSRLASAAAGPASERARLTSALAASAEELVTLAAQATDRAGPDVGAIFEAQALFASDPGIVDPAMAAIDDGATAEEAIDRVTAAQADALAAVEDEYFRERAADLRDVGRRVADRLSGRTRPALHRADGSPAIVASDDLDPSVVVAIRPELVAGIALAGGAPTGHAAIVARALGIPLALGLGLVLDARLDGAEVAVDGWAGRLIVEPNAAELAEAARESSSPAETSSGVDLPVEVAANVGSVKEAEFAAAVGADGIGLVRTEMLFLGRSVSPGLDEQRSLYRRIAEPMSDRPVVFRTLDIGGDKPASYLAVDAEMNPALGVRGVRLGLVRPDLLEIQLRALLEATPERPLWVMFPMVSSVEEVRAARAALAAAAEVSRAAGAAISTDIRLGIMVEVPAAAVMADALAREVDFFSIGTNDLIQYTLAADRTNAALAELASPLQPAVLRLIRSVTAAASTGARHVSVCGEAAADALAGPLLIGLGVDELSVAPASIARVRELVGGLSVERCREAAAAACAAGSLDEVRAIAEALVGGRELG